MSQPDKQTYVAATLFVGATFLLGATPIIVSLWNLIMQRTTADINQNWNQANYNNTLLAMQQFSSEAGYQCALGPDGTKFNYPKPDFDANDDDSLIYYSFPTDQCNNNTGIDTLKTTPDWMPVAYLIPEMASAVLLIFAQMTHYMFRDGSTKNTLVSSGALVSILNLVTTLAISTIYYFRLPDFSIDHPDSDRLDHLPNDINIMFTAVVCGYCLLSVSGGRLNISSLPETATTFMGPSTASVVAYWASAAWTLGVIGTISVAAKTNTLEPIKKAVASGLNRLFRSCHCRKSAAGDASEHTDLLKEQRNPNV